MPMSVSLDRQQGSNAWLTIGLREGKNREIRRAMETIGLTVNRLIRVSYGPFQLEDLSENDVVEIKQRVLADQMGWSPADPGKGGKARAKPAPNRGSSRGPKKRR